MNLKKSYIVINLAWFLLLLGFIQIALLYQSSINMVQINHIRPNLVFLVLFWAFLTFPLRIVISMTFFTALILDFLSNNPPMFYFLSLNLSVVPVIYLYDKFFNQINLPNFLTIVVISFMIKIFVECILLVFEYGFLETLYFLKDVAFYELFLNVFVAIFFYLAFFLVEHILVKLHLKKLSDKLQ